MNLPLLDISYAACPLPTNLQVENFVGRPSGLHWREQPWRARGSSLLMKGGSASAWGPGGRGEPVSQGQYPCNTSIFCSVSVIIIIIILHIHQALLFLLFTAHPEKEISRISPINWVSGLIGRFMFLAAELEFKDSLISSFHITEEEESEALRFAQTSPGVGCSQA